MKTKINSFELGTTVVPSVNGELERLGLDVAGLGAGALGFVKETDKKKSLVNFPKLKLSTWIPNAELKDVFFEHQNNTLAYLSLAQKIISGTDRDEIGVLSDVYHLCQITKPKGILGYERGENLNEVWQTPTENIKEFYSGLLELKCVYLGLAVSELKLEWIHLIENHFKSRLMVMRFLPSGMHKLEIAIYFSE